MTNQEKYRLFCVEEKSMPIYMQDWWLDIVCVDKSNWDVVIYEKNNKIIAVFPYFINRKYNFLRLVMPPLTQTLGIFIKYPDSIKKSKKISFEKKIIKDLINKLPAYSQFAQSFSSKFTNWLPFYWGEFSQTLRYTYIIKDTSNLEDVFNNFNRNKKRIINSSLVSVKHNESLSIFKKLIKNSFNKEVASSRVSETIVTNVVKEAIERGMGKIIDAVDVDGNVVSTLFVIWDNNSVYSILGGDSIEHKNSNASTLLYWEAIKIAHEKNLQFDFEGSMIEGVEEFFRSFGAEQVPYFLISKTNSKFLKLYDFIRSF